MPSAPALIYRTDDPLQWGTGKGSNLLPEEVDQNFWDIEQRLDAVEGNPALPLEILEITVVANQMTITMSDFSTRGPFTLPVAEFGDIGAFQPDHDYNTYDLVTANNGLYIVNHPFHSGATFVFGSDSEGPWYTLVMPFPTVYDIGLYIPGLPGLGTPVDRPIFQHIFRRTAYLPADLVNSQATLEDGATDDLSFPIMLNDTVIGSLDFAASGGTEGVFTFAADIQADAGDKFKIMPPVSVDLTAAYLTATIAAVLGAVA